MCEDVPACLHAAQEFAGELLALAGPLHPSAIAFDPAAAFSPAQQGAAASVLPAGTSDSGGGGVSRTQGRSQATQTPAGGGAAGAGRGGRPKGSPAGKAGAGGGSGGGTWAAALQLLSDYLVDESVEVIRTAQKTLRLLLATPEGREALQQCGPALRPYLEAFQHSVGRGDAFTHPQAAAEAAAEAAAAAAAPQLGSRQLWRCDARPYGAWVCDLAAAMLRKASVGRFVADRWLALVVDGGVSRFWPAFGATLPLGERREPCT